MLVARQGMTLTAIGVAIGLAASFALTRLMKTMLFGVSPTDAMTFVLIPLLLTLVALAACLIPARYPLIQAAVGGHGGLSERDARPARASRRNAQPDVFRARPQTAGIVRRQ